MLYKGSIHKLNSLPAEIVYAEILASPMDCGIMGERKLKGGAWVRKTKNREVLVKKCKICGADKNISSFAIGRKSKDGRTNICKPCKAYRDKARYQRRRKANLCVRCGDPPLDGLSVCEDHWFAQVARRNNLDTGAIIDQYIAQDNRCVYTGVELQPGHMTIVDGVWVSNKIGKMMGGSTKKEFEELCYEVAANI